MITCKIQRQGYKKNKCYFSTDWTIGWHRRRTDSSADCPEWLLKFICLDAIPVNYLAFSQYPELTGKPKSTAASSAAVESNVPYSDQAKWPIGSDRLSGKGLGSLMALFCLR
jgi:hypothetical protein